MTPEDLGKWQGAPGSIVLQCFPIESELNFAQEIYKN